MKAYLEEATLTYDGHQLSSLFAYKNFQVQGDSIVAFHGPCQVELSEMVDVEDVLAQDHIYSEAMVHFIIEHFDQDLEKTVTRQRLLVAIIAETIADLGDKPVTRSGDDLYLADCKLSVSIATLSRVSTLIHTGLNLSSNNTPIPTVSLPELGINDWSGFAQEVMARYTREIHSIQLARCKVRGVD